MCNLDETLSNFDWYLQQIARANSRERLDYIGNLINYSKWEQEDWTKDEDAIRQLRDAWVKRATEIQNQAA